MQPELGTNVIPAKMPAARGRRVIAIVIAAGLLVCVAGGVWLVVWLVKPPAVPESWDAKFRTIDSVIERHELIGLTRAEVETRYGTPTHESSPPENSVVYRLGLQRSGFIRIDDEWLWLRMDADGKVVEAKIRTY